MGLQMSLYDMVSIVCNLFVLYNTKRFMDVFFSLKDGYKIKATIVYALYFIVLSSLCLYFDVPIVLLITNVLFLFVISMCYNTSLKERLFSVFYIYIIMFSIEIIMTAITWTPLMNPFKRYGYENELGLFICKVLQFLVILAIEHIVHLKRKRILPLWMLLASLLIPFFTIVIEIVVTQSPTVTQASVVVSMVSLFLINFTVFMLYDSLANIYDRQMKSIIAEQERSYYLHQCQIMQSSAEDARNFRHDINNHFTLLQKMINDGNIKKAQSYLSELTEAGQNLKQIYSTTGNIVIDSIINYKLGCITRSDMEIQVEASVPTEFAVEIMDLSIILTNLLDNALLAATATESTPKLHIKIIYKKGMLLIRMINSYNGKVLYENGEIVSTKDDKNMHGRGIRNVRNVLEKYNGLLSLKHDASFFTAEVVLYASQKS